MLAACGNHKMEKDDTIDNLQGILDQISTQFNKRHVVNQHRTGTVCELASKIKTLTEQFKSVETLSQNEYDNLYQSYHSETTNAYNLIKGSHSERKKVFGYLESLDFTNDKSKIAESVYYASILTLQDLNWQLFIALPTYNFDKVEIESQLVTFDGKKMYKIKPILSDTIMMARLQYNSEEVWNFPDRLYIPANSFTDSAEFKYTFPLCNGSYALRKGKIIK
ncbi:hypothetical protein OAF80_00325 [bacterium]|jgi:hypothetical protein|nr:hypothetical protein [bacterium]